MRDNEHPNYYRYPIRFKQDQVLAIIIIMNFLNPNQGLLTYSPVSLW